MIRTLIVLTALLAVTVSAPCGQIPEGMRGYEVQHLELAEGVQLAVKDPLPYGGSVWIHTESNKGVSLSEKNAGKAFEEIRSPEMARELCELLNWGSLVKSDRDFQVILDVCRKAGFPAQKAEGNMDFRSVSKKVKDGFEVQFTAFVIVPHPMSPQACVQRLKYEVGRDASVKLASRTTYLPGPYIVWQTGMLETDAERQAERDRHARKDQVLNGVYERSSILLPRGRSRAVKDHAQQSPAGDVLKAASEE